MHAIRPTSSYLRPTCSGQVGRRNNLTRQQISQSVLPSHLKASRTHAGAQARARTHTRISVGQVGR